MLLVTLAIVLVSLVVQLVDGSQRIVYVSEPISDDKDLSTSGDGDSNLMCCVYGNCSCNSLDHALANLASNVLINITTDVMFTALINASNLENISIIGHNNPTVYCKRAGGIHFNFCHNCIIQDITWDGCGRETEPGIKLRDSSNILIEQCSFQYSKGPAIVLSGVSGHVNISHSNFIHNIHYRGHGAAIHYSASNVTNELQLALAIGNCNFTNNKNAKSLVYIENFMSIPTNNVSFQNTKFSDNKGVSIYVVNENVYLFEKVLFQNNTAEDGTGIYMKDHSTVIFGNNSDVAFIENSADNNGGAVFLTDNSSIIFDQNSMATFNDNNANRGTIYSEVNCNVTFQAACEVTFSNNSVQANGSAISSSDNCYITFTGNSKLTFINNKVKVRRFSTEFYDGGAICLRLSHISFEENSITLFRGNFANDGGAIYCVTDSSISFTENSTTDFTNNTATYRGGAIYTSSSSISFEDSSTTDFTNNTATYGGAIITSSSSISFGENSTIDFTNNTAEYGGAIITSSCHISFEDSSTTDFTYNTATDDGGAIFTISGSISFEDSSITDFTYNTATDDGGAIFTLSGSISFEDSSTTDFTNNTASYRGGAIYTINNSISFEDSSTTDFTNNTATYRGGAINTRSSSISFGKNSTTDFTNNTATYGGAIFTNISYISFEDSSTTDFTYNTATDDGGAIFTFSGSISFEDSSTTDFTNNTATYRGGAIYTSSSSISFEDSSTTDFTNNTATHFGGAICTSSSSISFEESSTTYFTNNTAGYGGAIDTSSSSISFEESSTTDFTNNTATYRGGAIYTSSSSISFEESSTTDFTNNTATYRGGAIDTSSSSISFEDSSTTDFTNNTATYGGAIYTWRSSISFEDSSTTDFTNNTATYGGAIFTFSSSSYSTEANISSKSNSHIQFNNNAATRGGAIYSTDNNLISFEGLSTTVFSNNIAKDYGGALLAEYKVEIIFSNNSTVTFTNNNAPVGETVYCGSNSNVTTKENSTVIFNNVLAKWCTNTCLPYTGQGTVTIDSNSIVLCSDQKAFACLSENCYCNDLGQLLHGIGSNTVVNISDTKAILSSPVELSSLTNVLITGQNNLTVFCMNTQAIEIVYCSNLTIQGITWIGCGVHLLSITPTSNNIRAAITIYRHSKIIIRKTSFQYSNGPAIKAYLWYTMIMIDKCNFMNNSYYREHGAAITVSFYSSGTFKIINCNFSYNEAKSIVYLEEDSLVAMYYNNTTFYNNQGVSIYLSPHCSLNVTGDILFKNNRVENGAGVYISDHSTIIFGENSNVKFINNSVDHNGSAIFMNSHSSVMFEQNSIATFNDNKGISGIIYSEDNSEIIFAATSSVTFNSNTVMQYGAAIYSFDNSHVTFTGSSNVTFSNNVVSTNERSTDMEFGGIIFSSTHSHISFDGNSTVVFSNNSANVGAAIFSFYKSSVKFNDRSKVTFNSNVAQYCGILTSTLLSNIVFSDNTEITFNHNTMVRTSPSDYEISAETICATQRTNVIFSEHSLVTFINNTAEQGGTVAFSDSNVTIEEFSTVIFNSNIAEYSNGGAFVCFNNSIVTVRGNSNVTFNNNKAGQSGGAIHSYSMCKITFKDNSTSSFIKNTARDNGGAILSNQLSEITFEGNSTVKFDGNIADNGGAFYLINSTFTFEDTSMISFYNNNAVYGGAVSAIDHCNITVTGNSVLSFVNNEASQSGGAGYFSYYCNVIMEQDAMVTFNNNKALQGGALCFTNKANYLSKENSTSLFYNNLAIVDGGSTAFLTNSTFTLQNDVTINFINSHAQYGGAILLDASAVMVNSSDKKSITFTNNIARIVGNSIYQDVADLCNRSCLTDRVVGISNEFIATPPNKLKFYDPAICIDDDDDTQCNSYYVQDIMLGSDIIIPVCVLDHYNNSVESTQFLVQSESNSTYSIGHPEEVLIGCNTFEGINIKGDQVLYNSTNLSVYINLNVDHNADWKQISVTLIVELSECHLGFWQSSESQQCECYNANDIVFCSGSSSTIKGGYWFGSVTGKPTVTFCPINYCNFTCCETSNRYYHLSPVRNDQCRSHRSGTACGSCTDGYTLSFDSTECLNIQSCTAGQTVLVILLTVTYWIVMVILVFAIMYYKVGIGYLFCITYYYSIVDILLSQHLQASRELYLTVSIMSSFSKITPQFLGELCLTTGMSGIDQQFIHYIHPTAVVLIIVMISLLARKSTRFTAIISRGIIHVICLLLLLSYTSIASTSLLLMRSLTFHQIDKVYTYLSPDIEYFHGRHLAYGIVALLCSISMVPGLPLLLTLQPILNHKFNFVKIKPLLDQFQGCYKDNYRCFAGYYMICRLVIITIVIANSSNEMITSYVLIVACGIIALIHLTVKPYNSELLNKFDGVILHFIIFISALPLLDDFDSPLVIIISFVLVILPLIILFAVTLFLHKDNLKKFAAHFSSRSRTPNNDNDADISNETPMREFHLIIDDNARQKAKVTICDM